jgi:undecaprenyl-diphosphatase
VDFTQAVVLGVVEGLTEFLPVSSTGHLTVVEDLYGLKIDSEAVTAFTAVIQMGAIVAVVVYFWRDVWRIAAAWFRGIVRPEVRGTFDYRMGWYVIVGTIPVGIVGLLARGEITGPLRNLWWVAGALIAWSVVMVAAERVATQRRPERDIGMRDAIFIGVVQCFSLIPGVSRSGATISAGLFAGLDRVAATRMSFLLSIPALVAAGLFEARNIGQGHVSVAATVVATLVSFVIAYVSVAWLLRFVAHHPITWFVGYRVVLGVGLIVALATGALSAT